MKVLVVINSLSMGGAEKLVADSLPLYWQRGVEVDLLLLNGKKTSLFKKFSETFPGRVISLGTDSVYSFKNIFRLRKHLDGYDIIHVHLFPALYFTAIAKMLTASKAKLVYTEHSTNNRRRSKFYFKILDRIIYRSYRRIITIANDVDMQLKKHLNRNDDAFTIIPNGIELDRFINAEAYPKSDYVFEDGTILIQVSSLRSPKDQFTILRAMPHLQYNVKLLLIGTGPNFPKLQRLINELGLYERVELLGSRMDVPNLLKTADIVILSSHYEGLSLSSLEGMASGRPFIASDAPGLNEIVKDSGILFPIGDEVALAAEIQRLIDDPVHYQKVVSKCQDRARQYDINVMVDKYINVYKSITTNER